MLSFLYFSAEGFICMLSLNIVEIRIIFYKNLNLILSADWVVSPWVRNYIWPSLPTPDKAENRVFLQPSWEIIFYSRSLDIPTRSNLFTNLYNLIEKVHNWIFFRKLRHFFCRKYEGLGNSHNSWFFPGPIIIQLLF